LGSYSILESSDDIAGTWRTNRYPGVAVDIPSFAYQFSFEPNYKWSRMFAKGEEINSYIRFVADKYQIKKHIKFNARVQEIMFDGEHDCWRVHLENAEVLCSRNLIAATGIFHRPIVPNIPGRELFKGKVMHPAKWEQDYDYAGKKVGLIGTGASAVQIIPTIAPDVETLHVFQRTPIWIMPKDDRVFNESQQRYFQDNHGKYHKVESKSRARLNILWQLMLLAPRLPFSYFISSIPLKMHLKRQVRDPKTREALTPKYAFGRKKPAISNEYLSAFNRDNVNLETKGIKEITETGIIIKEGKHIALDFIIFSTGYEATQKGNFPSFKVTGLDDIDLAEFWEKEGYQSYNGIAVPGFPNLFLTSGPFSFGLNWFDQLESNLILTMRVMTEAKNKSSTRITVNSIRHKKHHQNTLSRASKTLQVSPACAGSNSYYIDARGENSLPAVVTPKDRAKKVRNMDLGGFDLI